MPAVNPTVISWTNPTTRVDGSPYGQADNAGYELGIDGTGAVSIPLAWGTQFDLTTLDAYRALNSGTHTLTLAVVSKGGVKSNPTPPVSFQIEVAPMAPTNLVVA